PTARPASALGGDRPLDGRTAASLLLRGQLVGVGLGQLLVGLARVVLGVGVVAVPGPEPFSLEVGELDIGQRTPDPEIADDLFDGFHGDATGEAAEVLEGRWGCEVPDGGGPIGPRRSTRRICPESLVASGAVGRMRRG